MEKCNFTRIVLSKITAESTEEDIIKLEEKYLADGKCTMPFTYHTRNISFILDHQYHTDGITYTLPPEFIPNMHDFVRYCLVTRAMKILNAATSNIVFAIDKAEGGMEYTAPRYCAAVNDGTQAELRKKYLSYVKQLERFKLLQKQIKDDCYESLNNNNSIDSFIKKYDAEVF